MHRKFLFVINPNSGKKNSKEIIALIEKYFQNKFHFEISHWTNISEFGIVAKKMSEEDFTDIIAVGGDGSVNLVAKQLLHSNKTFGIIPAGSGNGLARSLGISINPKIAIKQIIKGDKKLIDSGEVNGLPFFCTSGVGFDAHIGNLFANLKTRGLKTYIKLIIKQYLSYKPNDYSITINEKKFNRKAFFITVANAGQFGNNFYISPTSKLNDGLLEVVVVQPFNLILGIGLLVKILMKKAQTSSLVETFSCTELTISPPTETTIHYDGEPSSQKSKLDYKINPGSLTTIIGKGFNGI